MAVHDSLIYSGTKLLYDTNTDQLIYGDNCDCCDTGCPPCIEGTQGDANVSIEGGCMEAPFLESGIVQMTPGTFYPCPSWPGECCWVWMNHIDASAWLGEGYVFFYVLFICYDTSGAEPKYNANLHMGAGWLHEDDDCWWMVNDRATFIADNIVASVLDDPNYYFECNPETKKVSANFSMIGQRIPETGPIYGGWNAEGCTATITITP